MVLYPREEILRDLHPCAEELFRGLCNDLKRGYEQGHSDRDVRPIKGFRTPREQQLVFDQRPVVEHLGKWASPHSYGLAVKFAGVKPGGEAYLLTMSSHDVEFLRVCSVRWGLVVDPNDTTRIIHPFWYLDLQPLLLRSGRFPKL